MIEAKYKTRYNFLGMTFDILSRLGEYAFKSFGGRQDKVRLESLMEVLLVWITGEQRQEKAGVGTELYELKLTLHLRCTFQCKCWNWKGMSANIF